MSERLTNPEAEPAAGAEEVDIPARNALVEENLPLAIWLSQPYEKRAGELGYGKGDVAQDGTLGLIRAAEKFDPEQGAFSTYATNWVRQSVMRGLHNRARMIRIPVHAEEQLRRSRAAQGQLTARLGRFPDTIEVAEAARVSEDKLRHLMFMDRPHESLDEPVEFADGTGSMEELVAERTEAGPMEHVIDEEEKQLALEGITEALELLREDEREVIVLRYRLDGSEGKRPRSREEVGEMRGCTRENVRLLENRGLKKIAAILGGEPVSEYLPVRIGPEVREKVATVIAVAARHARVNEEEVISGRGQGRRSTSIGNTRQIVALILREKLNYTQEMIAETLGYASRGSVSQALLRARNKRRHNADFAALYRLVDKSYCESDANALPAGELPQ